MGELLKNIQSHDLLKYGIIPELIGRLPVIAPLESLGQKELVEILTEPKNALIKQYKALFKYDDVELEFEDAAVKAIADKALALEIGARGLRSVAESIMTKLMYEVSSDSTIKKVVITEDYVNGNGAPQIIRCGEKRAS